MLVDIAELTPRDLVCPPDKRRIELVDKGGIGTYLEVRASSPGVATAYIRYKDKSGKSAHQRIGSTAVLTISEIRREARRIRAELTLGADPRAEAKARKEVQTLDTYMATEYFPYVEARKRSWRRDEELYRLRVKPKFGNKRLNELTRQQIQSFHTALIAEGLAPATANHHIKLIRYALNLAVDWKMLEVNPAARIPLLPENNEVDNSLGHEELERLLEVLHGGHLNVAVCQIALFLLATGCRLNEALTARWDDIDLQRRIFSIRSENSKSKRPRVVTLCPAAMEVLDAVGTRDDFEHIFINRRTGQRYTTIARSWAKIRSKAGLPKLRCHDLRHQHGRMLAEQGESLVMIGACLGHRTPSVTLRYAHIGLSSQQRAADRLSARLVGQAVENKRSSIDVAKSPAAPASESPSNSSGAPKPTA